MSKIERKVTKEFWRNGLLVEAGTTLMLSAKESKYLGHVLEEIAPVAAEPAPVPAPAPAPEQVAARKPAKAAVTGDAVDGDDR